MFDWTARIQRWAGEAASVFDWPALRRSLEQLSFPTVPHLAAAALAMDAGGLKSAKPPRLFSANLRRIDPTLNDDLLDLYGRSEQALANRFSFLNIGEDFGREIGWEVQTLAAWRAGSESFPTCCWVKKANPPSSNCRNRRLMPGTVFIRRAGSIVSRAPIGPR